MDLETVAAGTDPPAAYVFRATLRVEPTERGVTMDPATFETTVYRSADPPGEPGWLFFRDNLWHGGLSDPEFFREVATEALGTEVEEVEFRELRTSPAYLDALKAEIEEDLEPFNAASVSEALSKYLGSSIHVVE